MEKEKSDSSAARGAVVSLDFLLRRKTEVKCVLRWEEKAAPLQNSNPLYNNPRPITAADSNPSFHPLLPSVSKIIYPSASECSSRDVSRSCAPLVEEDRTVRGTELALFDEAVYKCGLAHESCSVAPSVSSQSRGESSGKRGLYEGGYWEGTKECASLDKTFMRRQGCSGCGVAGTRKLTIG